LIHGGIESEWREGVDPGAILYVAGDRVVEMAGISADEPTDGLGEYSQDFADEHGCGE